MAKPRIPISGPALKLLAPVGFEKTLLRLAAYGKPFNDTQIHDWVMYDLALLEALGPLHVYRGKHSRPGRHGLNQTTLNRVEIDAKP
jgi:hypothetical protein